MHSRSVWEGHCVSFRSEWNYSTCMSSVRVKREDESRAFRLLLLLKDCAYGSRCSVCPRQWCPSYPGSELEEIALTLKLIWFTDLMVCLSIWKSTSYSTELNFELDISLMLNNQILVVFFFLGTDSWLAWLIVNDHLIQILWSWMYGSQSFV